MERAFTSFTPKNMNCFAIDVVNIAKQLLATPIFNSTTGGESIDSVDFSNSIHLQEINNITV